MEEQYIDSIDWSISFLGPLPPQHSTETGLSSRINNDTRPVKTNKRQNMAAVACQPCRVRKVRCDGVQPQCNNCSKRFEACEYAVPKRRGPDKQPGTRIRLWRRKPQGHVESQTTPRSKRSQGRNREQEDESDEILLRAVPESVQRSSNTGGRIQTQTQIETLNQTQVAPHTQIQDQLEAQFLMQMQTHAQTRMSSEEYASISPPSTAAGSLGSGGTYYDAFTHNSTVLVPNFHNVLSQHPSTSTSTSVEEPQNYFGFLLQTGSGIDYLNPLTAPRASSSSAATSSNSPANYGHFNPSVILDDIPRGPSVAFNRMTWWDNLIQTYCDDPSKSAEKICGDITFLLNNTIYWYSFINLPFLLERLFDPTQRPDLQSSLVFGSLALSVLMKSSETGLGEKGRKKALMLRDAAQSALEASISTGWIEPSLAQAALILTLFESSAHPEHTAERTTSSIYLLDSLISSLGLLNLDIQEPTVSLFPADEVPIASSHSLDLIPQSGEIFAPEVERQSAPGSAACYISGGKSNSCGCPEVLNDVILLSNNISADFPSTKKWDREFAEGLLDASSPSKSQDIVEIRRGLYKSLFNPVDGPQGYLNREAQNANNHFSGDTTTSQGDQGYLNSWNNRNIYSKQAYWPAMQSRIDIQKEEVRRLCWSSLIVTTRLTEFTPYLQHCTWDLHITKQENFAIFFPGEAQSPSEPYSSKHPIQFLHCRGVLLWNVTKRLKERPDWEFRRAEFSGRVWMEATALESALAGHDCALSKNALYPLRELLYQLKFMITHNFTRFIPFPHTLSYDRNSAEEWLIHRAAIVAHVRKLVYFVTRFGAPFAALTLAKRPLSVWSAFYHIKAGTIAWQSDPTCTRALEQSLDFVALADFMVAMWRSPAQEAYYARVKKELFDSCAIAGVVIPASVPIPGLPSYLEASTQVPNLPFAVDVPILPLD